MAIRFRAISTLWLLALAVLAGLVGVVLEPGPGGSHQRAASIEYHVHVHTHGGSTHTHTHTHHRSAPKPTEQDEGSSYADGGCDDDDHHCCDSCGSGHSLPVVATYAPVQRWREFDHASSVCVLIADSHALRFGFEGSFEPPPPRAGPPPHLGVLRTVILLT